MTDNNQKSFIESFLPSSMVLHINRWLDVISTEYNFRFRRHEVQRRLKTFREIPRDLHIEGTNICNAKCAFCAYPQMERPKQVMSMTDFRQVIDDYVGMGGKYVSLSPIVGDPFVDPHLFERLDDLYEREQIEGFYFFTNAISMKPKICERLLSYADKLTIHVSWGGFDRETYRRIMGVDRFDVVCKNVETFLEMKRKATSPIDLYIELRCPASNCKGDVWERFYKYGQEGLIKMRSLKYGYDSWAGKVETKTLKKAGLEPLKRPYKRGACELLFMKPVVLANSKVNACACRDVEAELVVGDLKDSKLSAIWGGKGIDDIIELHERGDYPDVCRRCTRYVSVYNRRKSEIFKPKLNWSDD